MKLLSLFAGVGFSVVAAWTGHAQISRAFPDGVLLPNAQNKPVPLASAMDTAVLLPSQAGAAYVRERAGTDWPLTQTITGSFSAAAVNSSGTQFALARAGGIDLYFRSGGPGTWTMFGTAPLIDGSVARKMAFEGERVVAQVTNYGIHPGGDFLRVFEYNAADWEMVREIRINDTSELIQVGHESVVSDFSMYGDRIAVCSRPEHCIRIHERNQGGVSQWGMVKEITRTSAGVSDLGDHVALANNRLAATTIVGDSRRIDAFTQNTGGANQWGYVGTLDTVPLLEIDNIALHVDVATGRLAALGVAPFSSTLPVSGPGRLWVIRSVIGGIANWLLAAEHTVGPMHGYPLVLPGLGFAAGDLFHGLGPANATGLASTWLASIHRNSTGGTEAWGLQTILSGPGSPAQFGRSISASGGYVAVGMPDDPSSGIGTGCVMVWFQMKMADGSAWLPVGRFQATTPVAGAKFGASVSVLSNDTGSWLAVGAPGENSGRGAVYLFSLSPFAALPATLRLVPPTALNPNDEYGASVSFWPNFHLAVGATGDDAAGSNAGAVYLHEKSLGGTNAWGRRVKINRPAGEVRTGFGSDVAFTSNHLAVALPPATPGPGKVFLFSRNTGGTDNWGQISVQLPPAGSPQGFATSLATDPAYSLIVIGATGRAPDDKNGIAEIPGNAYVYAVDNSGVWTPYATLGGTLAEGHGFGDSVATAAVSRIVVGNGGFSGVGKTFTYDITNISPPTWSLMHTHAGTVPGDGLGITVAALPMFSFSAAPWADLAGTDAGAVFIDRSGSYEYWAANQGAGFTDWYPEADADGDGLENLGEFALGGNPLSASSHPQFSMVRTTYVNGPTNWPALRWDPPSLPYSTSMLRYQFQGSTDLFRWSNISPDAGFGLGDPPGRFFRIHLPREFFRIDFRYPAEPETGGLILGE